VSALKSFKNINEENLAEWLQSGSCEPDFQYMTDADIISFATKQRGRE
jgi:hypothetical protein